MKQMNMDREVHSLLIMKLDNNAHADEKISWLAEIKGTGATMPP
jgi:hypothetical protein